MKQNIIMIELRKAKSNSADICRLTKNQERKGRLRKKIDSNFNFLQAAKCTWGSKKKKECSSYYRTIFTPNKIT